jgi:hypothetical protein
VNLLEFQLVRRFVTLSRFVLFLFLLLVLFTVLLILYANKGRSSNITTDPQIHPPSLSGLHSINSLNHTVSLTEDLAPLLLYVLCLLLSKSQITFTIIIIPVSSSHNQIVRIRRFRPLAEAWRLRP